MTDEIIIYNTDDGKADVKLYSKDGIIWMNQQQMALLFDTSKPNISMHISNILQEKELDEKSVVKDYLTTAADGKNYSVTYYALPMVLAVGFRVRSVRGTQFRKWANTNLTEYLQKGFILDDERLKNPDGRPDYFDELLERIRDIRASEKRFYQKIRDLFALSSDYDGSDKATQMFFATVQNKLIYAITNKTAAELILSRADSSKPNMNLTSWKGSVVRKQDIYVSKNYLTEDEIDSLNRIVAIFLESAELHVKMRKDLTIKFWENNVDKIIKDYSLPLLDNKGSRSHKQMEKQVEEIYLAFDSSRKAYDAKEADRKDDEELNVLLSIEKKIKKRKQADCSNSCGNREKSKEQIVEERQDK
ncbi:virulence RhuM family protein [Treponema brennaborense]|uniref:Virulence protein n=1 Tax=Treponema brennaborense (strain DSM 12168 / CIP 105900 / DD5/3) TaxID=906968 RepID=F4LNK2_TREBD|nr:virulence RhuM family protein [Treponema brennaborense]AEE15856.1 virulence protein [Treponema brennaborense DSM 12168]